MKFSIKLTNQLHFHANSTLFYQFLSFIRRYLDYGIIYDQLFKKLQLQRLELIQHNAALALAGAITGSSEVELYQNIGLKSLYHIL